MRPLLWTAVLGCAAVLAAPACLATPMSHVTPEPGLYRVDFDGRIEMANGQPQFRQHSDGASGDVHAEHYADGALKNKRTFKGAPPVTQCIKSWQKSDVVQLLPLLPGACKNQRMQETQDGAIMTAECSMGLTTTTIRKLSAEQWEYLIDMPSGRPAGGAPDMSAIIQMMQTQIKQTPVPEARAKLEKQLAELLQAQKEMAKIYREASEQGALANKSAPAASKGAAAPMRARSRAVLTKISNTCN
ncbi:hypothetical protein [Massilia genomosp. 1]|uniref:Uncharacterized protein n=1 Tax=Massilia genomosp. 1 TaxID=2609280 RepID=A0ABX0MGK5_9BURK|nr:hypothetical protein [Massilia genomosp. 1]NHZ61905.1 hypothetical protein [Massilia genomosp. 1]